MAAGPGQGSGFGDSPRQTSVTEVVLGWLSCEGEEKGRTKHIYSVERTGKGIRLPGGGQESRRGGQDCGTQGSSLGTQGTIPKSV